ncbi:MAG: Rossmann fold nucleotide-binding protein [Streptosporangiales bacterium]|nr:Rossmann fold nucleotide-binding protein [Streptosporangiales bacterium]
MAIIEIETLAEFENLVALRRDSLHGVRVQAIDLRDHTGTLLSLDTDGMVFLGCPMDSAALLHVHETGGLVFPSVPGVPFDPYRPTLYTADELYAGLTEKGYAGTPDALMYEWYQRAEAQHDVFHTLLRAIHDDAMSDALTELLHDRRVVGVMGGHKLARGTAEYAAAAHLGRTLARDGLVVATGGGPGAMEAANLGAYLAPSDDAALDEGLARLGRVPGFADDVGSWADAGFDIRQTLAPQRAGVTVGVPTFFYGHEPPNVFASHIAKYFANSIREDGLLARSNAGVVVLPGAAGTVQEIFQAATPSYYAPGDAAPIVLVDREHWTERLPAWPLLRALASGRGMADRIHLVDSVDEVPALL